MAFEDTNANGPATSGPVSATAPPEDTTTISAPTNLTAPAPTPTAAPTRPDAQPASPVVVHSPVSGHFFHSMLNALTGGVLGTLAGSPGVDYSKDATGKTVATPRPDSTKSRLQRIAESALIGLSAGAQLPPQKSKAAAWGAGLGAGARGQMEKSQGEDLQKRQQAQEDYETQQKTLTDKAVRAAHNASTYSLWQKAMDEANDHAPERKKNMDVVDSLNEYISRNPGSSMQVQIVTPEAAMAMHEQDAHSVAKHTFLPLGMTQAKDANGNPVFEQDGTTPKQTGQIAVISGAKEGDKIPLPASFVDDLKEYGKLAGIVGADKLTAGTEVPLSAFVQMDKRMNGVKAQEIDGWKNAHDVILSDGKTHAQMNTVTSKTRPYPGGAQPNVENKPAGQAVETELKKSQIGKNKAETTKALAEANGTTEEIAGQGIDLVEGDLVPSQLSQRSKRFNTILKAARDYSLSKYGKPFDFEKAQRDYQFAQNVGTQNTLKYLNSLTGNPKTGEKGNLQLLVDISNGVDRSDFPALNDLDAWEKLQSGDSKYIPLYNVAVDVSDQFAKIMAGGGSGNVTSDKKIEQGLRMFRTGFSKQEVQASAGSTLQMLANRKREFISGNRYLEKDYGTDQRQTQQQKEPSGWTHKATAKDGVTIYQMPSGKIQDAQGNEYSTKGERIQ